MPKTKEESYLTDEFESEVTTWETARLVKAITAEGELYTDGEISSIERELKKRRIAVPLKCPICALINPIPASECAVCGHTFSEAFQEITAALEKQLCSRCHQANDKGASECVHCGHALDSTLQAKKMVQSNEEEIDGIARRALKGSLMCLLFPGMSLFLAPLAMSRAMDTLGALSELHKAYPDHAFKTSAKTRALVALSVSTLIFLLNATLVIYFGLYFPWRGVMGH